MDFFIGQIFDESIEVEQTESNGKNATTSVAVAIDCAFLNENKIKK
jgi:hypothetical protein